MDVHHLTNITKLKKEKRALLEAYSSHKHILPNKVALLTFIKCPPNILEICPSALQTISCTTGLWIKPQTIES